MNKTTAILMIVVIILSVFTVLYFIKPRVVTIYEMVEKIDTLYFTVDETVPPDTVEIIKWIPAQPEIDSIQVLDLDAMIRNRGTDEEGKIIIIDMPDPDPGPPVMIPYQKSTRAFSAKFIDGRVDAFAPCKVDSFHIQTSLNRQAYLKFFEEEYQKVLPLGVDFMISAGFGQYPAIGAGVFVNRYGIQYVRHGSDNLFLGNFRFNIW